MAAHCFEQHIHGTESPVQYCVSVEERCHHHMNCRGQISSHVLCALQLAKENSLSALEQAIADAKKQCNEASANECASAWDTVEELSAAIAHKKAQVNTCPQIIGGSVEGRMCTQLGHH